MAEPDGITRINQLRKKVLDGDEVSKEELKEAISLLRKPREEKAKKAAGKASKAPTLPTDLNDLFS